MAYSRRGAWWLDECPSVRMDLGLECPTIYGRCLSRRPGQALHPERSRCTEGIVRSFPAAIRSTAMAFTAHRILSLALLLALIATPAGAWLQRFEEENATTFVATGVGVDATGDALLIGHISLDDDPALGVVSKLEGETGAELWRAEVSGVTASGSFLSVATDAAGDVLAAGWLGEAAGLPDRDAAVVKLDGTTGLEIWRYTLDGTATGFPGDFANRVVIDSSGDVFAVAGLQHLAGATLAVVKLDGATGAELWNVEPTDGEFAPALAVDSSGNPILAFEKAGGATTPLVVLELDGVTGSEAWRTEVASGPSFFPRDLALDAADHVAVAGGMGTGSSEDFAVSKFDGATGTELWNHRIVDVGGPFTAAMAVAFDGAGDVIAVGETDPTGAEEIMTVVKLDGTTGASSWRVDLDGTAATDPTASAGSVAVDATGDVFAGGQLQNGASGRDGVLVRLDGTSGTEIWRLELDGTQDAKTSTDSLDHVGRLAIHPSGDPIAVGALVDRRYDHTAMAFRADRDDGSLRALPGTKLVLKDRGDPTKRALTVQMKDELLQTPPAGSVHDPRVAGATVRIWNPTTLEEAVFALPPGADWKALGNPPGSKGYRYADKTGVGPCRKLVAKRQSKLKVSCKASTGSIPFSLDEPSQGGLAASVRLGGMAPQCASFGGFVIADEPGLFKAKGAPTLPACP